MVSKQIFLCLPYRYQCVYNSVLIFVTSHKGKPYTLFQTAIIYIPDFVEIGILKVQVVWKIFLLKALYSILEY